jgi:hypothetical protein
VFLTEGVIGSVNTAIKRAHDVVEPLLQPPDESPSDVRSRATLLAAAVGILLGFFCYACSRYTWWAVRAEYFPQWLARHELHDFDMASIMPCCDPGFWWWLPQLPSWAAILASVRKSTSRCWGGLVRRLRAIFCSCCARKGSKKGGDRESLLESGGLRSDRPTSARGPGSARGRSKSPPGGKAAKTKASLMNKTCEGIAACFGSCFGGISGCLSSCTGAIGGRVYEWWSSLRACWKSFLLSRAQQKGANFELHHRFLAWKDKALAMSTAQRQARRAISRMVNKHSHLMFDQWHTTTVRAIHRRNAMAKVLGGLVMREEKRGFNQWAFIIKETKRKMQQMQATLRRASPEGKEKLKALYVFRDNAIEMQQMRKAMMAFTNHAMVACFNTWRARMARAKAKHDKIKKALARMSPEGRAMLKVIEKLQDIQRAVKAMDRAVRSFRMAGPRKAFNVWKTMQGMRIQTLQSTVWLAAQRGHRVGTLQEMFESIEPELVNELITMQDDMGMTPMLWAAKRGFSDVVEVLCAFSSDLETLISAQDPDGSAALHHAARKGHNEIVQLLLSSGAPVNATNDDKSTALHWAARKNNTEAIRMLVEAGCDIEARNKWGATALDNAMFAEHHGAISLLSSDPAMRKAAESKLALERKLRPTDEERQAKLEELAADALARREAGRARMVGLVEQREALEAAAKDRAQGERRMRNADNALSKALTPAAAKKSNADKARPWLDYTQADFEALEAAVAEARDAGCDGHVVYSERLRQGVLRLDQVRAAVAAGTLNLTAGAGPAFGYSPGPQPSDRGQRDFSHRSPSLEKESPIDRTLRKQRLAAMKGKK